MKSIQFVIYLMFNVLFRSGLIAQDLSRATFDPLIPATSFTGIWIRTDPDSVVLEIENYSVDSIEFRMTSYNGNYAGYLGKDRLTPKKLARVEGNVAYFNDSLAICDGYPLYCEGEKPCKLMLRIVGGQKMEVYEENCYMIYGGAGITWFGIYRRNPDIF